MILQAPYPALTTTVILPEPQFSDQESQTHGMTIKRAIDGTRRTYLRTTGGRRRLLWSFTLTRAKGLELRQFIRDHHSSRVRVIDHNDRAWVGWLMNNPVELNQPGRDGMTTTLEFEGIEQ